MLYLTLSRWSSLKKETTATFIGHNECYGVKKSEIIKAIEKLIGEGVTDFISGGQGGFDRLSARCVFELKSKYPFVQNHLVIPYLSFNIFDKSIFDSIIYPEGFEKYHFKAAIPKRNQYLVQNAAYAICYVTHSWGGAAKTYEYACKMRLKIINLTE